MPEDARAVRWIGRQAVVTLPPHIESSNAGQVREDLLRAVNSGAAVLIADLAATVSCDYAGAEAIARAYQRAVASGTELRLVVVAEVVRRAFSVNGLHRLIPMYPTLDAALAAASDAAEQPSAPGAEVITSAVPGPRRPAPQPATGVLLDRAVGDIFSAATGLQEAIDLPRDVMAASITDSLCRLDDAVREIRDFVFADQMLVNRPDPATLRSAADVYDRAAAAAENTALLRRQLLRRAHELHAAAAETATLLERRGDLVDAPGPIDYPTDIKRWQVIADQAAEIAERWEQRSL